MKKRPVILFVAAITALLPALFTPVRAERPPNVVIIFASYVPSNIWEEDGGVRHYSYDVLFTGEGEGRLFRDGQMWPLTWERAEVTSGLPRLLDQCIALGIERRVYFTGGLSRADTERLYRFASVVVMPSVSEPFGLVALESVRAGTPVIIAA